MMNNKSAFVFLASLFCIASQAEIAATNLSGHELRISFHGDGCSYLDQYPACAKRTLAVNETVSFPNVFKGQTLTRMEKFLSPQVEYGFFSFTYICRLVEFADLRVCSFVNYLRGTEIPRRGEAPSQLSLIGRGGLQLSVDENYHLSFLSGWTKDPRPEIDCSLARIQEVPALCESAK